MFSIIAKNDKFFLLTILILAFSIRMILAPLYISLPGEAYSVVPHDFVHYVDDAKAILEGKILYIAPTHTDGRPAPYGPLFMLVMAGIIKFFGENYLILKIPAILADVGIIVVLFYLTKNLFGSTIARYATIFYAFSLIPLLISGVDATSDLPLVFFLITSIFCLTKKNPNIILSAIFLGLSAGFKAPLFLIFLPMTIYYFIRTKQSRNIFLFASIALLTVVLMNLPFFIKAGTNIFIQIIYGLQDPIGGTSIQSVTNIFVNYFIYGVDERTRLPNPVISQFSFPLLFTASLLAFMYIVKFSLEDKSVELIRNVVLIMIVLTVFVRMSHWHIFYWSVPFIFVLIFYAKQRIKEFQISNVEIIGILLLVISSIAYAGLYRWTKIPEYTLLEQTTLFASIFLSTFGTFLMMVKNNFKKLWSFSTFGWHLWLTDHAKLFMVIGLVVPILKSPAIAFGTQHFISLTLVVFSNLLLLLFLHKLNEV